MQGCFRYKKTSPVQRSRTRTGRNCVCLSEHNHVLDDIRNRRHSAEQTSSPLKNREVSFQICGLARSGSRLQERYGHGSCKHLRQIRKRSHFELAFRRSRVSARLLNESAVQVPIIRRGVACSPSANCPRTPLFLDSDTAAQRRSSLSACYMYIQVD